MAILIDPPAWPAHGTIWSHLVSDTSYDELHAFARRLGFPRRSFDLDHYDVSAANYDRAVALGAEPVSGREVVHRLRDTGLRVRQVDRDAVTPVRRRQYLRDEWARLGELLARATKHTQRAPDRPVPAPHPAWAALGDTVIARWNEPHRSYHDERHLEDVLLALDHLGSRGERIAPETLLAAWFHDAVYTGSVPDETSHSGSASGTGAVAGIVATSGADIAEPQAVTVVAAGTATSAAGAAPATGTITAPSDEQLSADLAVAELTRISAASTASAVALPGLTPQMIETVRTHILATTPGHIPTHLDPSLAHLLDADLWIFASHPTRYADYAASVRREYAHVPDNAFARGRAAILEAYLARPHLYATEAARDLWEARARANVTGELAALRG